ncbi:putative beta-carotene-binding protein isoform X1 [Diabrotica virgifera virgifera]|uniref:Circadian clock-controlled protein-like n=1 Tax=Diabrotica virgifera virgifera TaxID=50390 RepID=A0ABM5K2D4_DIAVI|nr:putative beta-carotene-binding protein isoform X1 [Diabrotica virgifera virgifera]
MKYLLVLCMVWELSQGAINPNFVRKLTCKKSDPDFEQCFTKTLTRFLPLVMNGVPDLGIPPLDPLQLPELAVEQNIAGFGEISAKFTDLEVEGFKGVVFDQMKVDPINLYGIIKLSIPSIHIETDYNINGKIMDLVINNKGHFSGNFSELRMSMKISLATFKKEDGQDYFKINKLTQNIKIGNGHIKLESKDKSFQPMLNVAANIFNSNPSVILSTASDMINAQSIQMTKEKLNELLGSFPASVLLPE